MEKESITSVKEKFRAASLDKLPDLISEYSGDDRGGVLDLIKKAQKKLDDL